MAGLRMAIALGAVALSAAADLSHLNHRNTWVHNDTSFEGGLRVEKNPTICAKKGTMAWSGYFEVHSLGFEKHLFYWAFAARNNPETAPTVLWMTGGPGCSSMLALFTENGPCQMDQNGTMYENPYSWNEHANLVFVDQPAGTGYSYSPTGGFDHNEAQVAVDMGQFVQALFKAHPKWQKNKFFITAESYGGHYAPAVAHKVFEMNKNSSNVHVNLDGVAIGNGLTDPEIQYYYYPELAYNYSIKKIGMPIITKKQYGEMMAGWPKCKGLLGKCNQPGHPECPEAMDFCNNLMFNPYAETGRDVYNIRKMCDPPPLCMNLKPLTNYLNSEKVKMALGVPSNIVWSACNFVVNGGFSHDWARDYQQDLLPLLESAKIRVLIYAGDLDFICNWLGNQAWTLALPWSGKAGFNAAEWYQWSAMGKAAGMVRTYKNFNFMRVYNAGHMVPHNQPMVSLTMLDLFMNNKTFPKSSEPLVMPQ